MTKLSYMLHLPEELIVHILALLPLRDLISCVQASQHLHVVFDHSVLLQYGVHGDIAAVEDNPNCSLPLSIRLAQLHQRELAWSEFKPTFQTTIHVPHRPSGIYDLTGGVYLLGDSPGPGERTNAINYVVLPDSNVNQKDLLWPRIDVKRDIIDVGLALQEHNLIAVVTIRPDPNGHVMNSMVDSIIELELLNFSNGKPHKLASRPKIRLANTFTLPIGRLGISIEIVGDHLALILFHVSYGPLITCDDFFVFNWKKGTLTMRSKPACNTYHSLVFLSPDVLLLPNTQTLTFDLVRIPDSNGNGTRPVPLRVVQALALPQLSAGASIRAISCRAEPNPMGRDATVLNAPAGNEDANYPHPNFKRPFHSSSSEAIVLFNIYIQQHIMSTFSLIIHRKSLLAYLPPMTAPPRSEISATRLGTVPENDDIVPDAHLNYTLPYIIKAIPWAQWGPPVSRWLRTEDITTRWITTSAGQRYVQIDLHAWRASCPIMIYDFNPLSRCIDRFDGHDLLCAAGDDPFAEDVYSQLPYGLVTSKQFYDYDAVLMDEERIIGMRMDPEEDNVTSIDVLYFG